MKALRYTLLTDGSSDKVLMPILDWLLRSHLAEHAFDGVWADLRRLPFPPRSLAEKIKAALDLYPCEILFIHRDAERESLDKRCEEIHAACVQARLLVRLPWPAIVCVIPVRMQEAWLLIDLPAIRRAAGNPNGTLPLTLPDIQRLENLPDPKAHLHQLLSEASGLSGRRLKSFKASAAAHRVCEYIDNFSLLRVLSAFVALEENLIAKLQENHWN